MRKIIILLSLISLLQISCVEKQPNEEVNETNKTTSKILPPNLADSLTNVNYFRTELLIDNDIRLNGNPASYTVYSNYGSFDDYIIKNNDTLFRKADLFFDENNRLISAVDYNQNQEFFYDTSSNLLLRKITNKEGAVTIHSFEYDKYSNLISLLNYEINLDSIYELKSYKKYLYRKNNDGVEVEVTGVENWADNYHKSKYIRRFDKNLTLLSESTFDYNPLNHKQAETENLYAFKKINNKNCITKKVTFLKNLPHEKITKSYNYDNQGRVIQTSDITTKNNLFLDYTRKYFWQDKQLKILNLHTSNTKDSISFPIGKNGLQETEYYYLDKNNKTIKEIRKSGNNKEGEEIKEFKYKYDENNNWVYCKQIIHHPSIENYNFPDDYIISFRKIDYSKKYLKQKQLKKDAKAMKMLEEILKKDQL